MFHDGSDRHHHAVVTNRTERGDHVVNWHREKAGTIEQVHDQLKNGLAAGRMVFTSGYKDSTNSASSLISSGDSWGVFPRRPSLLPEVIVSFTVA